MSGKGNKGGKGGGSRQGVPGSGGGNHPGNRERQVSEQQSSGFGGQRRDGPRGNQGGAGAGPDFRNYRGQPGASFQGGGGGRGRGGGGGGDRPPPPTLPTVEFRNDPNPYIAQRNLQPYVGGNQWKPFFEIQKDVVLHQRPREPATWKSREITVFVNHFPVEGLPKVLFLYHVNCQLFREGGQEQGQGDRGPPQPRRVQKDLTEAILKWLIILLRQGSRHDALATDFSSKLYTTKKLEELRIPLHHEFTVTQLKQAGVIEQNNADENNASRYVIDFQFANEGEIGGVIDASPILEYLARNRTLQGYPFSAEQKQTLEAALNAFMKNVPRFPFYSVGRSTIVPLRAENAPLGEGLMAWKGCSMSTVMGWKPFINLEISNTAMLRGVNVLEALREYLRARGDGPPGSDMTRVNGDQLEKIKAFLRTTKVQYMVANFRYTKAVRDVFNVGANHPRTQFDYQGKQVTVCQYYQQRYGIRLRFPNGMLLVTSNNAKIPAELCTIREGQSVNRKLTGAQTDKMLTFARKSASEHFDNIQNQFTELGLTNSPILKAVGIRVPDGGMLKIPQARVLVPPTIRYGAGGNQQVAHYSPTEGAWDIWRQGNFKFYENPQTVEKWGVLVVGCSDDFYEDGNYEHLQRFIQMLHTQGRNKGVMIAPRPVVEEYDYLCENREGAAMANGVHLTKILEEKFKKVGCTLVLVVFPEKGDPIYGHVKHAAEVDVGILTQCVQRKSVIGTERKPGPTPSLVQNVLLKLNMKLGGINHVTVAPLDRTLAAQFCTLLMDCPVMVLGADVTHPPPGSRKLFKGLDDKGEEEGFAPSYASVTGSLDKTCMPFNTEMRAQRKAGAGAAEVIQDLEEIVKKMIRFFWEHSKGVLPLKIIYFRDGVGEGQFKEVLYQEMTAIRKACRAIPQNIVKKATGSGEYEPKITFITVQKRHKTRIFWKDGSNIKNAPPGTVIDQQIVHPTEIDFYLLSHYGALGTSRPSRYHVLWDDSDFSLDQLQSLAYTLCYMYARCTKSVKMPAATYYAHLAADRAKKLCEGFENKMGEPTLEKLNTMLGRLSGQGAATAPFWRRHPMHFI